MMIIFKIDSKLSASFFLTGSTDRFYLMLMLSSKNKTMSKIYQKIVKSSKQMKAIKNIARYQFLLINVNTFYGPFGLNKFSEFLMPVIYTAFFRSCRMAANQQNK